MFSGYQVRLAVPDDVAVLPDIEGQAARLFKSYPRVLGLTEDIYAHVTSVETLAAAQVAGRLWVAVSPTQAIVGFALVSERGGYAHLDELDVLPRHGRRGIGSALVDAVCEWARAAGYPAVTLRTFRDVPWNRPFYVRKGFQDVAAADLSNAHVLLVAEEKARGLRTDLRVTMRRG